MPELPEVETSRRDDSSRGGPQWTSALAGVR